MAVQPIPEGMHSVTPHLICEGAANAIEFYKKAFNAEAGVRMAAPDGRLIHAQIKIGDSTLMLVDSFPEMGAFGPKALKGSPVTIHLYVEDVDKMFKQAVAAGAVVRMPLSNMFWGDRYGLVEDPFGHSWSLATHMHDYTPEEMQANMKKGPGC